jgi:hypothetical protein
MVIPLLDYACTFHQKIRADIADTMVACLGWSSSIEGPAKRTIRRPAIAALIVLLLYSILTYGKNDLGLAASMQLKLRSSQKTESMPVPHDLPHDLKACFDTSLWFNRREGSRAHLLDLVDGRAKYINASHQYEPTYNATCPFMKPRYNCDGTPNGKEVSRWNFVLEHNATSVCDLRKLIHHMKGPGGVANFLLYNSPTLRLKQSQDNKDNKMNIFIHGNSFLRQVFQSLACQWQSQITGNLLIHHGKPALSMNDMIQRTHKVAPDETPILFQYQKVIPSLSKKYMRGNTNHSDDAESECHAFTHPETKHFLSPSSYPSKNTHLYSKTTHKHCEDDLAMMEFNNSIRFYYIFRPFVYQNISMLYDTLHLDTENVHRIIYNDAGGSSLDTLMTSFPSNAGSSKINFGTLASWKEIQTRDIGKWLGADNVGMVKKPDDHPCMPGVPDDEANLLLFLLMHYYYGEDGDTSNNLKLMKKDESSVGPEYCMRLDWCP